jgi:hypothetical protein
MLSLVAEEYDRPLSGFVASTVFHTNKREGGQIHHEGELKKIENVIFRARPHSDLEKFFYLFIQNLSHGIFWQLL